MADNHIQNSSRIIQITRIDPQFKEEGGIVTPNPNYIFVQIPKNEVTTLKQEADERDGSFNINPTPSSNDAGSSFQQQLIKTEQVFTENLSMKNPLSDDQLSSFAEVDIFSQSIETIQHKYRIKYEPDSDNEIDEDSNKLTYAQSIEKSEDSKDDVEQNDVDTPKKSYKSFISDLLTKVNDIYKYKRKINSLENKLKLCIEMKSEVNDKKLSQDDFTRTMFELVHWKDEIKAKYKNRYDSMEFKMFALNLYVSSRQIYKHLYSSLCLPSVNELKQLKLHLSSQLNRQSLELLAVKLFSLPDKAKYCTLTIDTIDLKRHLYYNIKEDEIIGLHNLKGHETNVIASTVYYIMLNGIAFDWKQPVAYIFLVNKTCFAELDYWISNILQKLYGIGIKIIAITSSQEPTFVEYAKYKSVTIATPFFFVQGQKIHYMFDVPHLLKSLRNDLINYDFYYENQKISWSHIEALYAYKKLKLLNVLPKIKDAHVTPSALEKNDIKYAAQIFSQSVFSTFDILMSVNYIPKEAQATAKFIKTINDLFDILNSNEFKSENEFKSALRMSPTQMETLVNAQKMIQSLHVVNKVNKADVTNEMSTMKNITITIHALILLSNNLKEYGIKQILTRRLNKEFSDSLKNELNIKDERTKTTAIKFIRGFRKMFLSQLLNTKIHKFMGDLSELLMKCNSYFIQTSTNSALTDLTQTEFSTTPVSLQGDNDYRFQLPKHEAFTYVAGYLLFKCSKKHKCPDFDAVLTQCPSLKLEENINAQFSFYMRLKVPPSSFLNIIRRYDDIFVRKFPEAVISKPAIMMLNLLRNVYFVPPCACFPTDYLLTLFVKFKIYSILIYNKNVRTTPNIIVNAL